MRAFTVPTWFRRYLRFYGILHITAGLLLTYFSTLNVLIPLAMIVTGIASLTVKRWAVLFITVLALLVAAFYITIVIPSGFGNRGDGLFAGFTFLLVLELFTAVLSWRFTLHR